MDIPLGAKLIRTPSVPAIAAAAATALSLWGSEKAYSYIHDMLALGNTMLFLDVYPLHAFYKLRGLQELKTCLKNRQDIYGDNPKFPVLWPVGEKIKFGFAFPQILQAFEAIEAGNIADSVRYLADHEQRNILQPIMYEDKVFKTALKANQLAFATDFLKRFAEPVELTLASQCQRVNDGRTVGFSGNAVADLADVEQRMEFVLRAAAKFNQLLHSSQRKYIEQSLKVIAAGGGVDS